MLEGQQGRRGGPGRYRISEEVLADVVVTGLAVRTDMQYLRHSQPSYLWTVRRRDVIGEAVHACDQRVGRRKWSCRNQRMCSCLRRLSGGAVFSLRLQRLVGPNSRVGMPNFVLGAISVLTDRYLTDSLSTGRVQLWGYEIGKCAFS